MYIKKFMQQWPKGRYGDSMFCANGFSDLHQRLHDNYVLSMVSNSLSDGIRSPFFNSSNVAQCGCCYSSTFGPYNRPSSLLHLTLSYAVM